MKSKIITSESRKDKCKKCGNLKWQLLPGTLFVDSESAYLLISMNKGRSDDFIMKWISINAYDSTIKKHDLRGDRCDDLVHGFDLDSDEWVIVLTGV